MSTAIAEDLPLAAPFTSQVAPLLARRCLECHDTSEKKGGLDLARSEGFRAGGDSGAAIDGKDPHASLLWQRVEADEMPPKHPLTADEKNILKTWIAAGAPWAGGEIDRFRFSTDARGGYDWWSLQPVVRPQVPVVADDAWSRTDVDRFVNANLRSKKLTPSGEADRRTLIRRVTFDLTGLPATPEETDAFVNDPAPDAYERLVDRLLASKHYGVRWARHWLDVVRFGESNGFEYDEFRPDAWPYRDWVVGALNDDLPYDEFVRLQLAGDVLRPGELDAALATGFLTAGAYDTAGQVQQSAAMRAVVRQDELEDLTGVVGQTFLGLTVNCARCHDHKFDPIRQREYFQLVSALSGVKHGKKDLAGLRSTGSRAAELARLTAAREQINEELARLERPVRERLQGERAARIENLKPLASWDFADEAATAPDAFRVELFGGAKRTSSGLVLEGGTAYALTPPIAHDLREKTLEVWVRLANVDQRGGAAISVQSMDGAVFDAVVFGERDPKQWVAGSDNFSRTQGWGGPAEAGVAPRAIHLCVTYAADGAIACYRDGQPYGASYRAAGVANFEAGRWQIAFGLRHSPPAPGKLLSGVIERARLYDRALSADEAAAASGRYLSTSAMRLELSDKDRTRHEQWSAQLATLDAERLAIEPPRVYATLPKQPEVTHLLARGNPSQPLEPVVPAGIASLAGIDADFGLSADSPEAERRKKLADWIANDRNPLFARVMVNRLWRHHFGVGLVDTPNDFGFNGGRPSHPELLDWLAAELIAQGYRLKPLHRLLATSAAYRQKSRTVPEAFAVDADNRSLWRKSPSRLEAEAVRDAMLSAAGVLDEKLGGPGFQEMKIAVAPGTNTFLYSPEDPANDAFKRRTLYRVWARSGRSALLDVLDCPDPSTTSPKRAVTTTPLQALALLNNSFVLHLTDKFAARIVAEAGDEPSAQADRAYRLAFGRAPSDSERTRAVTAIREHGVFVLARALFNSNEFIHVD